LISIKRGLLLQSVHYNLKLMLVGV
jgi:hypothetical protein